MANQEKRSVVKKYVGLRVISFVLRLVGSVAIALSVVGIVAAFSPYLLGIDGNQYPNIVNFLQSFVVTLSISGLVGGIAILVYGQLLGVLIDIALNTASLSEIAQDTNYFYERLRSRPGEDTH